MRFVLIEPQKEETQVPEYIFELKVSDFKGNNRTEVLEGFTIKTPYLKDLMEDFTMLLDSMKSKRYIHGCSKLYPSITGFNRWFKSHEDEVYKVYPREARELMHSFEWSVDEAKEPFVLEDYRVFYFNEFGERFEVRVEF